MYYTPIDYRDIQLNQHIACVCKSYADISTGVVTYIGSYGLTLTDATGSTGILFRNFDFNKELT